MYEKGINAVGYCLYLSPKFNNKGIWRLTSTVPDGRERQKVVYTSALCTIPLVMRVLVCTRGNLEKKGERYMREYKLRDK
jgi:hypothetical protein